MSEIDTVGKNYYKPAQRIDAIGGALFWLVASLSIAILLVDSTAHPLGYRILQIVFIVFAILFFAQGMVQRLYFLPRAEDKRRQELLSNSFGVPLTHEVTVGYYNNDQKEPLNRLAASVMESAFFTENIVRKMLVWQRMKTIGYIIIYIIAVLERSANLELLTIAAQLIFSEEIVARWARMEWLRCRSEKVFENLNGLFTSQQPFSQPATQSRVLDLFSLYETTKSTTASILSDSTFQKHNPRLTEEWKQICNRLGI